MKTISYISLIALCITVIFSSCTIEKRLYSSGYHVEWFTGLNKAKKNKVPSSAHSLAINDSSTVTELEPTQASSNNPENVTASVSTDHSPVLDLPNATQNKWHSNNSSNVFNAKGTSTTIPSNESGTNNNIDDESEPRTNPNALIGSISALAIIVLAFTTTGAALFWGAVILGVIAAIFSGIGLSQINKYPKKWKGKYFAIAGVIIAYFALLVAVSLILFIIAWFDL
ncbi:MAG: hypothetical protein KJO64_00885 [Bacteroidia bacterium]|nr:hypothetical protein [Bacteroidia bacterium]